MTKAIKAALNAVTMTKVNESNISEEHAKLLSDRKVKREQGRKLVKEIFGDKDLFVGCKCSLCRRNTVIKWIARKLDAKLKEKFYEIIEDFENSEFKVECITSKLDSSYFHFNELTEYFNIPREEIVDYINNFRLKNEEEKAKILAKKNIVKKNKKSKVLIEYFISERADDEFHNYVPPGKDWKLFANEPEIDTGGDSFVIIFYRGDRKYFDRKASNGQLIYNMYGRVEDKDDCELFPEDKKYRISKRNGCVLQRIK